MTFPLWTSSSTSAILCQSSTPWPACAILQSARARAWRRRGGGGNGGFGEPGSAKTLKLVPQADTVALGDTLKVNVLLKDVHKTRGVQLTINAVAADGKYLEFVGWSMDTSQGNYLFAGHETYSAADSNRGRLAIVSAEGSVDCEGECYVATALFLVTAEKSAAR